MPKLKITYEMIEPLIVHQEIEGRRIFLEFALPGSDEVHEASGSIRAGRDVGSRVRKRMTMVARNQARRSATMAIRSAVGGGVAGRMSSMAVSTAAREAKPGEGPTKKEIRESIVNLFEKVSKYFHWNEQTEEWEKPGVPPPPPPKSPFEKQIEANPIADAHDKNIFARVMAELAYADGTITPEEAEFFKAIIPSDQPSLDQLAKSDPVSKIEAEEVTDGVKGTIYMFAWTISIIDLSLDPVEQELLYEYGDVFNLSDPQRDEFIKNAKYFVLEKNIDPDIPREELFQIAAKINLSNDDAERCRIAFKRRSDNA